MLKNPTILRVEVQPAPLVSQAVPECIMRGGYKELTGKNVIIAVLDTGIDFRHPDFITYDANGLRGEVVPQRGVFDLRRFGMSSLSAFPRRRGNWRNLSRMRRGWLRKRGDRAS